MAEQYYKLLTNHSKLVSDFNPINLCCYGVANENLTTSLSVLCFSFSLDRSLPQYHRDYFKELSRRLSLCSQTEYRCGLTHICPKCARHAAKKRRQSIENIIFTRKQSKFLALRLSIASDELSYGVESLKICFLRLRKEEFWKSAVEGGSFNIELVPCNSGEIAASLWNIHTHIIIELRIGKSLDGLELDHKWRDLLSNKGAIGSAHLEIIENIWGKYTSDKEGRFCPVAFYSTKRKRSEWFGYPSVIQKDLLLFSRGVRLSGSFGSWRGIRVTTNKDGIVISGNPHCNPKGRIKKERQNE